MQTDQIVLRLKEIEDKLLDESTIQDRALYKSLRHEHSYLFKLKEQIDLVASLKKQAIDCQHLLLTENDPDFKQMAREELKEASDRLPKEEEALERLLVPPDPMDSRSIVLEIRAAVGGEEAALFAGDCARMYVAYALSQGWKTEVLSSSESDQGGYREFCLSIVGDDVYRFMKYESGGHRVQRIPKTETQGRIHTSAVTVAILPEPDEDEEIELKDSDIRVDTYRSSGAGGQHVNTTDSAVRLTHMPTGVVVTCQDERSQIKNRDKAMRILRAKLRDVKEQKLAKEQSQMRSSQVGSGDRSDRIRTYNFPQNRVTDHRINLTLYNLDQVMAGKLDDLIGPIVVASHKEALEKAQEIKPL